MKNLISTLSILMMFAFMFNTEAVAQKKDNSKDAKKVKKEWKNKAKGYKKNPLALKALFESNQKSVDELTKKNAECNQRLTELQSALDKCEAERNGMKAEVEALKTQLAQCNTALEASKVQVDKGVERGLVFKVQIGAFQFLDLKKYFESLGDQNLTTETVDNLNKYTIGKFKDLNTAEAFKKDIRRMGVKDAWIVAYFDGVRIDMKEAKSRMGN